MTNRKKDHLDLAHSSQVTDNGNKDFYYEPLWANHKISSESYTFLNKKLKAPFWISSMTGGESRAAQINQDLAWLAQSCSLGMGLGSCRPYIEESSRQDDFMVREQAADILLAANLGIAQVANYIKDDSWRKVEEMLDRLGTDLLMVHINPLQEWFQPEGDKFVEPVFDTLIKLKKCFSGKIGVKEVGQGFGPKSLEALVEMEVDVIELAGFGGTNFTLLESIRSNANDEVALEFASLGHNWSEMVTWLNKLYIYNKKFPEVIISGGIRTPIEAAKAIKLANFNAIIGMGYPFLKWQQDGRESLKKSFDTFYADWVIAMKMLDLKKG